MAFGRLGTRGSDEDGAAPSSHRMHMGSPLDGTTHRLRSGSGAGAGQASHHSPASTLRISSGQASTIAITRTSCSQSSGVDDMRLRSLDPLTPRNPLSRPSS